MQNMLNKNQSEKKIQVTPLSGPHTYPAHGMVWALSWALRKSLENAWSFWVGGDLAVKKVAQLFNSMWHKLV